MNVKSHEGVVLPMNAYLTLTLTLTLTHSHLDHLLEPRSGLRHVV